MSGDDLEIIVALAAVTFVLGILLGFIGAGGAGLAVALLTSVFHLPAHQAIGTALASMCVVTIAGAISHFRQGNVAVRAGLVVGLAGAVGAVIGADRSQAVPEATLQRLAGLALLVLAVIVWARIQMGIGTRAAHLEPAWTGEPARSGREWAAATSLGLSGGASAAFLGVGMAPFLQLGFLTLMRLPLRQTIGTTMLTLVFISATGSLALARHGDVSLPHLIGSTLGLASGAYVGARYTRRARQDILRLAVVAIPIIAGLVLLLF